MINLVSYGQNCNWLIKGNGLTDMPGQSNQINKIVQNENGFLYVTGHFRDTLIIENDTLISTAFDDAFIAKFDTLQNLIWIKQIQSTGVADCKAIVINNSNQVILGGYFQSSIQYDNSPTLASTTSSQLFILWLDPLGNLVQSEFTSSSFYSEIFDMTIDSDQDLLITGNFLGPINKDNLSLNASTGIDFFCIKVKPNGQFEWGVQSEGGGNESRSIDIDLEDNIYLNGSFQDGANIGGNIYYSLNGNHNLFTAKYTTEGNCDWVFTVVGANEVHGNGIHINSSNEIGVIGEFRQYIDINDTTILSEGGYDILFFMLSTTGDLLSAQGYGGLNNDIPRDIDSDFYGNFLITGKFGYNTQFGDTIITATGTGNTFLLKANESEVKWVKSISGTGLNEGHCLYYGLNENIYLGGNIRSSINFNGNTISAPSGQDFYLAEIGDSINHDLYLSLTNYQTPDIRLFPNPSQGSFILSTPVQINSVDIFSYSGQKIITRTYPPSFNQLYFNENLLPGSYILLAKGSKKSYTFKLVIL